MFYDSCVIVAISCWTFVDLCLCFMCVDMFVMINEFVSLWSYRDETGSYIVT